MILARFWTIASVVALCPLAFGCQADVVGVDAAGPIGSYTIEAELPHMSRVDTDAAARVDEALRTRALALIDLAAAYGNVTGGYKVHLDNGRLLSVSMQYDGYHPPLAHPMHFQGSVTADLRTGRVYGLADLFADGRYVAVLSDYVRRGIDAQGIPLVREFHAIEPDQDFYLTPDALVLYFPLYDLAPYVWGFPEFEIPLREIAHLFKPDSVFSALVRAQ